MTTVTATDPSNIIPLVRPEVAIAVVPSTTTGHVFLRENEKNEQSGTDREVIGGFLGADLISVLADIEVQQKATNHLCRTLIKSILCHPEAVKNLRVVILEANGDKARYIAGLEAMLGFFDAGQNLQVTSLCKQSSAKNGLLSEEFQTKKIKPFIEDKKILLKKEDNSFRWATLEELKELAKTTNDLPLETTGLPLTCNSPAIASSKPTIGLRLICKRIAVNPLAKVRNWQRQQYRKSAMSNAWVKYDETTNTVVEQFGNEYDPKAQCPRSEKAKEMIRKAAIAESKARLEEKIAAATDKTNQQQLRQLQHEAALKVHSTYATTQQQVAEMQARRMLQRERLATYKPVFIAAGIAAAVLAIYINGDTGMGNPDNYPVEMATMPVPALGQGE